MKHPYLQPRAQALILVKAAAHDDGPINGAPVACMGKRRHRLLDCALLPVHSLSSVGGLFSV